VSQHVVIAAALLSLLLLIQVKNAQILSVGHRYDRTLPALRIPKKGAKTLHSARSDPEPVSTYLH